MTDRDVSVVDEATHAVEEIQRGTRLAWRAIGRGVIDFYNSDNLTFAASIAYYSLMSLFPFLLLMLTTLARSVGSESEAGLLRLFELMVPGHLDFVLNQIRDLGLASVEFSIATTILLAWASLGVFSAITAAVNHAWGVDKGRGYLKDKLVSFVMMMAAGLLVIVTLLLMSAGQIVQARWFAGVVARYPAFGELTGVLYRNASMPMIILAVALILYYVPNAKVRVKDVWLGALVSAGLWRLAFEGFSWYVRDLSRFSVHGSIAAVVAFLLWVYLSAVIFLYGVEVSAAYARLRKDLPPTAPAAAQRDSAAP